MRRLKDYIVEEKEEPVAEPVIEKPKGNPIYLKYLEYQAEHPSAIVAYRLGDFYEVFGDNAIVVGNELELTIISRDVGLENRIPMIGFPYHAAEMYFAKIVKIHDLYIIENDEEKQFMEKLETVLSKLQDEEDFDDLTEEEMREFDGDDCAEGSDYRKCGVCREVAEKLYDKYLYRKAFAYNDESPEQTAFKRGYAQGYCDGKETVSKELHRILQDTLKGVQ